MPRRAGLSADYPIGFLVRDNKKIICIAIVTDDSNIPDTISLSSEHLYADYDIVVVGRCNVLSAGAIRFNFVF